MIGEFTIIIISGFLIATILSIIALKKNVVYRKEIQNAMEKNINLCEKLSESLERNVESIIIFKKGSKNKIKKIFQHIDWCTNGVHEEKIKEICKMLKIDFVKKRR